MILKRIILIFSILDIVADIVVQTEHTIDGRLVDVKRAVPRDMAPTPSRYNFQTRYFLFISYYYHQYLDQKHEKFLLED
jgi:hypothetical protein